MRQITTLSRINVEIEGRPISQSGSRSLGEIHVRQRLSAPAQCELVFFDPPERFDDASALTPGSSLRVLVSDQELFAGQITAVEYIHGPEGGRELRARAYDPLHKLGKRQPVRAHVEFTLADLARDIAADAGLSVE